MIKLTRNKSKSLRKATYNELLLPLHTLWMNKVLTEADVSNIFNNFYDIELVDIAENEITVKSLDGKMTHSIKI